ncbi:MAG: tyrosine-type recombinase/integrase [Chitinophagaceae bacterium]|nr:tyrosine-type recombinase/integrase [Chitinophagaceae bacterium]
MPVAYPHIIQSFLDYLKFQKRYSQHTIISYQNDLTAFFDFTFPVFGEMELSALSAPIIRSWLANLKEQGMESRSINRKISALKSFFKFQLKEGAVSESPMATIISPKNKKRLPQYVDEKGTEILFRYVEFEDSWRGRTDHLIMQLLYNTGMRQAELVGLKETQIDKSNSQIKVLGKGNKERILPLTRELINILTIYMEDKRKTFEAFDSAYVLINEKGKKLYPRYVYNTVKLYLSKKDVTTIDKRSPHILRHTFATHLMNNGADINAVKELLGHSSLAATQVYTHNTIDKLKDIYKKAHPKA